MVVECQHLGAQSRAGGQPEHHELARAPPPTAVGEPQEVEGLRFALSSTASVVPGEAPDLDQPRLLRMQLQPELLQPLGHFALETLGVAPELEPGDPVV